MFKKRIKYSKEEFEKTQLPNNRKEVFYDVLKQRYDVFIKLGLLGFILLLPIVLISFYFDLINLETANKNFDIYILYKNLALVILSPLIALYLTAFLEVVKKLVWYEPILISDAVINGVKNNYKQILIISLYTSLIYAASNAIVNINTNDWILNIIKYIPFSLSIVVVLPTYGFVVMQITVYKEGLLKHIVNGFILYIVTFIKSLLIIILNILPFVLTILIPNLIIKYIVILTLITIYTPITLLVWQLHTHSVFDQYINKDNYENIYKKGINKI